MKRSLQPQRLPPLNVAARMEPENTHKHTEADMANHFQAAGSTQQSATPSKSTAQFIEAAQTILFTACSLQRTVGRCIGRIGNESLHAAFAPLLHKVKASTEKLITVLDVIEKRSTYELCNELIQATSACISILKELCWTLRTRLSTLVQGLDAKFSRNLLMNLYSATVDMKDAWQVISPYLSVEPAQTLTSFMQHTKMNAATPTTPLRNRSQSELAASAHSPMTSPLASPNVKGDNTQLYTHLRNAVTSSLHVLNTLKQSIEETVQGTKIPASLERKLNELLRQTQYATELSHRLDKNVEANMGSNKEDLLLLPTRKESSRRIWEDTSIYLKAIVSVMSFIRSISTEEEFVWPKSIKQGCLYVTRMTAEVAKLWNSSSTFAEDGFFLGRQERSSSVSEQPSSPYCTSPASTIDIPRNTQVTRAPLDY
ncbi:uncharacterized protein ATC70_003045 [Mucor velutinosus]|uniref:Uncharacterized protein n=1 Tax=Mucor velutinosus TaxID=708070 RepID=A0AAN7HYN8_9FUNG|nr:hypothetical protein ATC70_003045 [Mucor velutinosus]